MAELYAKLIIAKRRTIDAVPSKLKSDIILVLKELGYDENGDMIAE